MPNNEWIEQRPNSWTYELKCPVCEFSYSPKSEQDGTINATAIYKFCPKCGTKLDDPAKGKRW